MKANQTRPSVGYAKDRLDHYSSFMIWSGLLWLDLVLSGLVWSGKKGFTYDFDYFLVYDAISAG